MNNILLFGLLICGVTILLLLSAVLWAGMKSRKWTQVIGKILRTEIYESADKTWCAPLIEYTYEVQGSTFTSKSYDFALFTTRDRRVVEGILDAVRGKETITVYYHPWFPKVSVIVPGVKNLNILLFIAFIAVMVTAFCLYKLRIIT